ncbi:MAG: TrmH family RNA methyltransferase [Rhodothermales bacterium]
MKKLAHHAIPRPAADELRHLERRPVSVLLHDVRSAHNVGSVFRTADAFRIGEVLLSGYTPDPDDKKVHKTALGAEATVPWRRVADVHQELTRCMETGVTVAALELTDVSVDIRDLPVLTRPILLLAGNEVDGIPQALLDLCDLAIEIPQYGAKQSLNVSVAVAVALFELTRTFRS